MIIQADKFNNKRLRSSNITVVVSISLVLFLIGLMGLILINTSNYFNYLKQQFVIEVFLYNNIDKKDEAQVTDIHLAFKDTLQNKSYVKDVTYISKEAAYQFAKMDLGPDKINMVDKNIFPASIKITLQPEYVTETRVNDIKKALEKEALVEEVKKDDQLMVEVYKNIDTILMWILGIAIVFLLIAIVLINNSIRLKIFSKRFTIKTMQLVGANRRFIIKPFILQSFWLGLIGSGIALFLLAILWWYFTEKIDLPFIPDYQKYGLLAGTILLVGILITVLSTFLITFKFLKLRTDDLYYS